MQTSDSAGPTVFRGVAFPLLAALALALASCSRDGRPPVYPVGGTVTFQKRPATKAVVVLRPVAPGAPKDVLPRGEVGPDGTFRISTFADGDGAPAGEYAVTITWPETKKDADGADITEGDRLGGRYNDPTKSKWKVQVKEGINELEPIRLD